MRRKNEVEAIVTFIRDHPESYASLVVCRRALGQEVDRVTPSAVDRLQQYLYEAGDDEISAFRSIVS